jgi:hypothetical protein
MRLYPTLACKTLQRLSPVMETRPVRWEGMIINRGVDNTINTASVLRFGVSVQAVTSAASPRAHLHRLKHITLISPVPTHTMPEHTRVIAHVKEDVGFGPKYLTTGESLALCSNYVE